MAKIPGLNIPAPVVPKQDSDEYPSHRAKYGHGGWREVSTIAERDAITSERREAGMAVYVTDVDKIYILNLDLVTWKELELGKIDDVRVNGSSVVENKIADITVPTAVSDLNNDLNFQTDENVESAFYEHDHDTNAHSNIISPINQKIDGLSKFTPDEIVPTTENFIPNTEYTLHNTLQKTANLFGGMGGLIQDINDLIPDQASVQNQLADKTYVNSQIAANATEFRGNWANWAAVPTRAEDYPEDSEGQRTPKDKDYLVLRDASDYDDGEDTLSGSWRFVYVGDWDTNNKNGWKPQYQIGSAFTPEQQAAIDSGATATKINQIATNTNDISGLKSGKRDVITSASKVYTTDGEGNQTATDYTTANTANTIVQRDANSQINVAATPTADTHAASKKYVDDGLSGKLDKNSDITGGTHTKITYDNKGLVTAGADLTAEDIPEITLSKITDVTATATEINYLSGVTSSVQTQIDSKLTTTSELEKVYGTDDQGRQVLYDKSSFGQVDDVRVDGTSVVTNKIANIDLSGKMDQYSVMPDATLNPNKVVQYIGTNGDYTHGYFYESTYKESTESEIDIETISETLDNVLVDKTTLEEYIGTLEDKTLTFIFTEVEEPGEEPHSAWTLDGEEVNFENYGITYDNLPSDGDTIIVEYTAVKDIYEWTRVNVQPGGSGSEVTDVTLNGVSVVTDHVAVLTPGAQDISYDNGQYTTVKAALDKLLYVAPTLSISINVTSPKEKGASISEVKVTWNWSKMPTSQKLSITNEDDITLDPATRTYTYTPANPITSNTTFKISGTDGTTPKNASTTLSFKQKRYWGVSAKTSLTDEDIIVLSQEFSDTRVQTKEQNVDNTRIFNCSGGKYFYFAIKTSLCNGIKFKVGGLSFSDMIVTTRQFINESGYSDSYNIYRVNNLQTGSEIAVEVL